MTDAAKSEARILGPQQGKSVSQPVPNVPLISAETCRAQIIAVLSAWGMDPKLIETTAEVMIETDLAGVDSHGI